MRLPKTTYILLCFDCEEVFRRKEGPTRNKFHTKAIAKWGRLYLAFKRAVEEDIEKDTRLRAERWKRWKAQNPEKARAQRAVERALRTGRLKRPSSCQRCGKRGRRIAAHHPDHAKPLDVIWLCDPCHSEESARRQEANRRAERRARAKGREDEFPVSARVLDKVGRIYYRAKELGWTDGALYYRGRRGAGGLIRHLTPHSRIIEITEDHIRFYPHRKSKRARRFLREDGRRAEASRKRQLARRRAEIGEEGKA